MFLYHTQWNRHVANRRWRAVAILILCGCWFVPATSCGAGQPAKPLRVATVIAPPFAMKHNDRLSGFSIDLWKAIAGLMSKDYEMVVKLNVKDLLASVKSNECDLGISNISITAARARNFDFSLPIYDGGLQIMTKSGPEQDGTSIIGLLRGFVTSGMFKLIGLILLLIVIPAHIIWLLERHQHDKSIIGSEKYIPGIVNASWWAATALAAQAEQMPKSSGGRIVALLWMFVGVVFIAYFTAQVTANLTLQNLYGSITQPGDLAGKWVATTTGSTSEHYLKKCNAKIKTFSRIEDVYAALDTDEAQAVVFDSPVLLYYTAHEGRGRARVVGQIFQKESYAIVFPSSSLWRKPVNLALQTLKENGVYDEIYHKWFSKDDTESP